MIRPLLLSALLVFGLAPFAATAQETPKSFSGYNELFDHFDKRRKVLITRFERLREKERVEPEDLRKAEDELVALDREYCAALRTYVDEHPGANDLMPARFEMTVSLSRLEDRLEDALKAADEFLRHHADAELAADARFVKAQTLFRIAEREVEALAALEQFIEKHGERPEADAARMMRVRTLMLLDRTADARRALEALLKSDKVKGDDAARAHIQGLLDALDWVGRDVPQFELADTAGKPVKTADLAGKPALLFVWDTTSEPCLGELPFVLQAQKQHGEKLAILGVSVNESRTALEQWLARQKETVKFRNVWIDRAEEGTLLKKLAVRAIPFNILLDAQGKVYRYDVRSDDMLRYVARLAK